VIPLRDSLQLKAASDIGAGTQRGSSDGHVHPGEGVPFPGISDASLDGSNSFFLSGTRQAAGHQAGQIDDGQASKGTSLAFPGFKESHDE